MTSTSNTSNDMSQPKDTAFKASTLKLAIKMADLWISSKVIYRMFHCSLALYSISRRFEEDKNNAIAVILTDMWNAAIETGLVHWILFDCKYRAIKVALKLLVYFPETNNKSA